MDKIILRSLIFFLLVISIPFINSLTISDTHLTTSGSLYDVYINGSISIDNLTINSTTISIYNLQGSGNFTAINTSQITFYNLTLAEPYNDIQYANGTILSSENIGDSYTIIVSAGQYFQIGNYFVSDSDNENDEGSGSGSGGGSYFFNKTKKNNQTNDSKRLEEPKDFIINEEIEDNKENNVESIHININNKKILYLTIGILIVVVITTLIIIRSARKINSYKRVRLIDYN